jgi:hypothetical protein
LRIELERNGVSGAASLYYVPRNRGDVHFNDSVSRALYDFHMRPRLDWADLYSRLLQSVTPLGCDAVTFPPSRKSGEWTASQALADALGRMMGVPCQQLAFWAAPPPRELHDQDLVMRCPRSMEGLRVAVVIDFWRTGASMWQTVEALKAAGAQWAGAVALAKVVTWEEYRQSEDARAVSGAELAGHQHGSQEYAHNFLKAVGDLPEDADMHRRTLWEQLAVCQRAYAAYCEFALRNVGTTVSFHPYHQQMADDLQSLVDATMAALRTGPFAGRDEDQVKRLFGDMTE